MSGYAIMLEGGDTDGEVEKAAHVVYQCGYHLVWTPRYRYRILQGDIKEYIDKKIRSICEWKQVEILERCYTALGGVLRSETPQPKIIMDDDFGPDSPTCFFSLPEPCAVICGLARYVPLS